MKIGLARIVLGTTFGVFGVFVLIPTLMNGVDLVPNVRRVSFFAVILRVLIAIGAVIGWVSKGAIAPN